MSTGVGHACMCITWQLLFCTLPLYSVTLVGNLSLLPLKMYYRNKLTFLFFFITVKNINPLIFLLEAARYWFPSILIQLHK